MEYTTQVFVNFLNKLIAFDKDCRSVIDKADSQAKERSLAEAKEWTQAVQGAEQRTKNHSTKHKSLLSDFQKQVENVLSYNIRDNSAQFSRLQKCKDILALIASAENAIVSRMVVENAKSIQPTGVSVTLDQLIAGNVDFLALAYEVNSLNKISKPKAAAEKCAQFLQTCRMAEDLLNAEIAAIRSSISSEIDNLRGRYADLGKTFQRSHSQEWDALLIDLDKNVGRFASQWSEGRLETANAVRSSSQGKSKHLARFAEVFHKQFPPEEFADEYLRIYSLEPTYANYECFKDMPQNIHICTLEYDISALNLCEYTKAFLNQYYPFMYREKKLCIPYCASFGKEFNYIFRFKGGERQQVVKNACDLGMRLFTMLPPAKLNFTFVDPVTLGESFAMFTRLVDVDDRTSEVINGKIWSAPSDIEEKLKIMTDHISNITQRCLQGKYDNIYEYNRVAEQNAEAYQVLMLMDFPAGMTDQSLKLLEQIVTSGPKCGVFTIIYRNESQYEKIPDRSRPLISNIESNFQVFDFAKNGTEILINSNKVKDRPFMWKGIDLPTGTTMDQVISTLKKGIKSAEKVVIGIEKVSHAESTNSTKDGIRIPIGIHGANEVQYLTLGVGGSHHALIAGVAGSGKSSLLHTIILRALTQYSPEELVIYLVDFKRGVEFKIYADFELPSFKVIAIESEREFGYNILMSLEREQKIRADLFKKAHVDKIEEYREIPGKKMPRVLVIMDEFHELFSSANDEFGKKSAQIMERIVRQGRAFGVHMILASQSYSNITGIDRAVFDQMAVRIVLKCSKADANLLLDNGSNEIDLISIDDPGRAVYNSEAGNKEYNSHFRVAYIAPEKHRGMLQEISDGTRKFLDKSKPTRILLSNIEDNQYSIFNQFTSYDAANYATPGRLYIGEPLSVNNNMPMDLTRSEHSNILMIGGDTDKARSMFAFAMLSLCINYRIKHGKAPEKPFIYLLNCKPLEDSYFTDIPKLMATELLSSYICNIPCWDNAAVGSVLTELYENVTDSDKALGATDKYFFVFGYQRAEGLKSEAQNSSHDDVFGSYDMMSSSQSKVSLSNKKMMEAVLTHGAEKGVHTILWHDSYQALNIEDNKIGSYFTMKVAFDMPAEEFSRFVGANDISLMSENNAIYYNRARDNQKFRPYQAPDEEWLREISEKLQ